MLNSVSNQGYTSSVDQLIYQTIAIERQPTDALIQNKSYLSNRTSVYNNFSSNLKDFREIVKDYYNVGSFNTMSLKTASSSDDTKAAVSANSKAAAGTYSLFINRLAQRDIAHSKQMTASGTGLAGLGNQQFTIKVGDSDTLTIDITVNGDETNKEIMQKVADAINDSGLKVSAGVIDDTSTTSRLTLTSNEEGSNNSIEIKNADGSRLFKKLGIITNSGARKLAEGTAGGFLTTDISTLDSEFVLNGLTITRQSNEVSDVIDGVTIDLLAAQDEGDGNITLTIENDKEEIETEIKSFIEKFNEIVRFIREKTAVDSSTYSRGELYGDTSLTRLKLELSNAIFTPISIDEDGDPQTLADLGIQIQRDGQLSISNNTKFDEQLDGNIDKAIKIFTDENGVSKKLYDLFYDFTKTGGTIDAKKKAIDNQVQNLSRRISDNEKRLEVRAEMLRKEYTQLQEMLSSLNSQQSMIQNSMSSINSMFSGGGY